VTRDLTRVKLSSGSEIQKVCLDDWLRQCVPQFKATGFLGPTPTHYSNYYLMAERSGLCADALACAFEQCAWTNQTAEALMAHDLNTAKFEDLQQSFPIVNLPDSIAFPKSVRDLVETVKFAAVSKMNISVKTSGHSYAGSSTMKDSLLINLRSFPKYSHSSITECDSQRGSASSTCKLAIARGKNGVIRVGGGEVWDDVYRAVHNWNHQMPRTRMYDNLGGGAGTVGAAGGWLQGGGLGLGTERSIGIGVDQVLELEMVLADGTHVKFGPTRWEKVDGHLYPQTMAVGGTCNHNVDADESKWAWADCDTPKPFEQLWFAVRGGGGGTYGVITAVHYQLHDFQMWYGIYPDSETLGAIVSKCTEQATCDVVKRLWIDFAIDFLYNPNALGVDSAMSNRCGASNPAFTLFQTGPVWWCLGGAANVALSAWKSFVSKSHVPEDVRTDLQKVLISRNVFSYGYQYLAGAVADLNSSVPIGHIPDDAGADTTTINRGTWSALVPRKWLLQKNEDVFLLLTKLSNFNASFHIMGGNVAIASDGMTAVSQTEREAAFQTSLPTNMLVDTTEDMRLFYRRIEEKYRALLLPYATADEGNTFLGYTEYNHISSNVVGPLKANWSIPCPSNYTKHERARMCMSLQESVWGTELLTKLESVKTLVDPDHLFNCYFCVGNYDAPDPPSPYAPPIVKPSALSTSTTTPSSTSTALHDNSLIFE